MSGVGGRRRRGRRSQAAAPAAQDGRVARSCGSRAPARRVVAHAREDAPNECCGMIASRDGEAVAVHRAATRPPARSATRWTAWSSTGSRPRSRTPGYELGAIYHSHTRSAPEPSQTDINLAFYPDALYVIVGLKGAAPDVRAWRIVDGAVSAGAARDQEDGPPPGGADRGSRYRCRVVGWAAQPGRGRVDRRTAARERHPLADPPHRAAPTCRTSWPAGPREILVPAPQAPIARELLGTPEPGDVAALEQQGAPVWVKASR